MMTFLWRIRIPNPEQKLQVLLKQRLHLYFIPDKNKGNLSDNISLNYHPSWIAVFLLCVYKFK
jgi:hypothetical protein